ncbi:hypothetical protein [Inquilinus sp. CA228]|uniref:hypothetical protein n=1 Tax=Inquilinus sp. CA228 TaxID=3455609 RepID=UPI003F8CF78E
MTKTLQDLYFALTDNDGVSPEYDARRAAKITEIADHIRDHLHRPELAEGLAERVMASAEEMGRIYGDEVGGEIRGHLTTTGNPLVI